MEKTEIDVEVTILCSKKVVKIKIVDEHAVVQFLEIDITPKQFTALLGGLSCVSCKATIKDLDKVGKKRSVKMLIIEMPGDRPFSKSVAAELAKEQADEGWEPSLCFTSQSSFFQKDGKHFAKTRQLTWEGKSNS